MVRPLDDFQGPLNFHGHLPWVVCKAALSLAYDAWFVCIMYEPMCVYLGFYEYVPHVGYTIHNEELHFFLI